MLKEIIFFDEITLWWTKDEWDTYANHYKLYLDGSYCGETKKTHYSFIGLSPKRTYQICLEAYIDEKLIGKRRLSLTTKPAKKPIDVSKPPYNAVGDGKTLNTQALQKALDDCTVNDFVCFPAGIYLSGALDIHSDTEIYFEDGACLQGSTNVDDYLPKIRSRFEGIERICYRSLLNMGELNHSSGYNCNNIAIRGKGKLYGGGKTLAFNIIEIEKKVLH